MFPTSWRYIGRISVFLLVVIAICWWLQEDLQAAFQTNPILNGVILAVFILGILHALWICFLLIHDEKWLAKFMQRPSQEAKTIRSPATANRKPKLLPTQLRFVEGRLRIGPVAALLDALSGRLEEMHQTARYMVGLLVFLGLLGTFWGLIQTITGVREVIGSLSLDDGAVDSFFLNLQQGLETPLAGMGTAFSSSLFGLAGSLALGFIDLQTSQAQNRFYVAFENWLHMNAPAQPLSTQAISGDTGQTAYTTALLSQMGERLDDVRQALQTGEHSQRQAHQAVIQLTDRLTILTDQMRAEQNLLVKLAEQQLELKPLLAQLVENTGNAGANSILHQNLSAIDHHLKSLLSGTDNRHEQLIKEMRSEIRLLARTIASLATQEQN